MDDQHLRTILRDHEAVERALLPAERARLLERLMPGEANERAEPEAAASPADVVVDITPAEASPPRRTPIWLGAAAVVLAVVGLLFVVGPRQDNDAISIVAKVDEPVPVPQTTPTPVPPPPTCPAAVSEFIRAVDGWDGIEQWASLIDERRPDPDLPTLAAAAIVEWKALAAGDPLLVDLEIVVDEAPPDLSESTQETITRRGEPLQQAFDRMRVASTDMSSVLAPCAESISLVADELNLPPISALDE